MSTTKPAEWATERERGNLRVLRAMRWLAITAGRPVARLVLHPITLYYLVANAKARRASAQYLTRALQRPARWTDVYRHIHRFAATILDRVYFLQERFGQFDVRAPSAAPVHALLEQGEGVMLAGAHMGSFEAMRAIALQRDVRVAMLMYEDNARLINATLAAIAPNAELHTIALGRPGAMLSLRRWLDDGGLAGMLADRTLPSPSERERRITFDFLGHPVRFSDGPFRLAALLRRPVFFMAGLYEGGNRYDMRFVPLVDFRPDAPTGGLDTDQRVRAALERYVTLLGELCVESPYNWFNFYDFWVDDDAT